jgi:hypothetical protein
MYGAAMADITDIFISHSSDDSEIAKRVFEVLQEGRRVFFAPDIPAGADWNELVQRELRAARCVVVLWSANAKKSLWVHGEAADAFERGCYIPVSIDDTGPPKLFKQVQTPSISRWVSLGDMTPMYMLKSAISTLIDKPTGYQNLEDVKSEEPVESKHLHLIHSCWRVNKTSKFGFMPYLIHLIVYGHESALARIEFVEYYLPGYPNGHDRQRGGPENRLFELKELANGFSIAQAKIHFWPRIKQGKQPIPQAPITLSRFINMSDNGPRLDSFILSRAARVT